MRRGLWLGLALLAAMSPRAAGGDAIDDAFARGNELAAQGDWEGAIAEYEQARRLLPARSALLSHNLGTAYAHAGETGRAILHLRRALHPAAGASDELAEAARRNLSILERRVESEAAGSSAQASPPESGWERLWVALAGPLMGWSTLLLGWATVAGAAVRTWARSRGRPAVIASALTLLFAGLFAPAAVLHGLALRAEHAAPRAISLDPELEAREGPGTHRKVTFVLQAGSRVRIIDRSPGWTQIRLEGGLSGWIPERALGLVDGDDAAAAVLPPGAQGS